MGRGYAEKFLRVNLSTEGITASPVPEEWQRRFLGGVGIGAWLMWNEVPENVHPLSPENRLIFLTGPVNGTFFSPSGRYIVVSRSPLTGWWSHSSAGGFFGPELKYAGYDFIIIQGKAERPVYLHIDNDFVELRDARHLRGKNTLETTDIIQSELGDPDTHVACIGQAGENLVKFACIMSDRFRAAGRTGLGAVMGSKNLKAIAVRGTGGLKVANPEEFSELTLESISRHKPGGRYWEYVDGMRKYGTFALTDWENAIGRLPTKNHWTGYFEDAEQTIGMEVIKKKHFVRHRSCFGCSIQCKYISEVREGEFKGTRSEGPEYETINAFTSNFLSTDTNALMKANQICNLYGMDTISAGHTISWAFECFEKGILTESDTDGRLLKWGNDGMRQVLELLDDIAMRRGFGKLLAEGAAAAARQIGKGSEAYAIHVNNLEASGQDPRPHKSMGLTYAINVRGADHLTAISCVDELGYRDAAEKRYGKKLSPVICDRWDERYKGYLVAEMEELLSICDSLLLCKYGVMWPPIYYFDDYARIIPAITGFEEYRDVREVRRLARRICHLRRAFNVRLGWTRKNDSLHPRFTEEPMPTGPAKGQTTRLEPMLKEYYTLRRYDWDTGFPTRDELVDVGLPEVAEALRDQRRLVKRFKKIRLETDPKFWLEKYGPLKKGHGSKQ